VCHHAPRGRLGDGREQNIDNQAGDGERQFGQGHNVAFCSVHTAVAVQLLREPSNIEQQIGREKRIIITWSNISRRNIRS
jgi:hypothetical protein